jgi:hypothetical protein
MSPTETLSRYDFENNLEFQTSEWNTAVSQVEVEYLTCYKHLKNTCKYTAHGLIQGSSSFMMIGISKKMVADCVPQSTDMCCPTLSRGVLTFSPFIQHGVH